jgi:beta-1,4-mannosyl-glycoprotein beta-1,4-N-acetylglucosaminyltransferase
MNMDWYRHLWNVPLRIKMLFGKKIYTIEDGGWHFSYLGNDKFISNKIASSAHFEKDKPEFSNPAKIKEKINAGKDLFDRNLKITYVPIDSTFPEEIVKNKKRYSKLIKKI